MTRPTGERHDDTPDRDIGAQLPWYVNQTLSEPERAEVERHLSASPALRDDLAQWQHLAEAVRSVEVTAPEPSPEQFAALMAQIDDAASPAPASTPGTWARLAEHWQALRLSWADTPGMAQFALALQCALIVLCIAGITLPWPWSSPKVYRALTDEVSRSQTVAQGGQLRLVLADEMTAGELRRLLGQVRATIVGGPSPLGVYTLAIPLDAAQPDALQKALQTLRAHAHVTLAEPISEL